MCLPERESVQSINPEEIQKEENQENKEARLRRAPLLSRIHREGKQACPPNQSPSAQQKLPDEPEAEFLLRLRKRHGFETDAEAILHCVLDQLNWDIAALAAFLDFYEKQTTAPEKLKNPPGHYRRLVNKFQNAASKRRDHERKKQQLALEANLQRQAVAKQTPEPVCPLSLCNGAGERWNEQGFVEPCSCIAGQHQS